MKTLHPFSLLFALILYYTNSQAQKDSTHFVTTWSTSAFANSYDSVITINTDPNYNYNFDVDWDNDGVFDTLAVKGDVSHKYSPLDTVTIRIRGKFPRIFWKLGNPSRKKILSIEQWGTSFWKSMESAFMSCSNLLTVSKTDAPRLDSVENMAYMFDHANSFNDTINHWNVSSINNMENMFYAAYSYNQPLNGWDVSSVKNMKRMFYAAVKYNEPLNHWDVSSVTDMSYMFSKSNFNQSIGNWDVSSVTNMSGMFERSNFNQSLNNWDVSSVIDMSYMFKRSNFNQSIGNWDVSSVKDMIEMFREAEAFNQSINNWNVSSVIDMSNMFDAAKSFNQPLNKWNISSVTNISSMFTHAVNFNQNLGEWNISSVKRIADIFDSTAISTANYDSTLISWQLKPHQSIIGVGAAGLTYCASDSARKLLIQEGWVFYGDSKNCTLVGINEQNEKEALFELYPNPSTGFVFLEISDNKRQFPLQIYNTNGSLLREIRLDQTQNRIDLSEFSNGLYLFRHGKNSEKVLLKR